MDEVVELKLSLKLNCFNALSTACCLLKSLISLRCNGKDEDGLLSTKERSNEKVLFLILFHDLIRNFSVNYVK